MKCSMTMRIHEGTYDEVAELAYRIERNYGARADITIRNGKYEIDVRGKLRKLIMILWRVAHNKEL